MAFTLNESVDAIKQLHEESNTNRATHCKAIKALKEAGKDTTGYEAWLTESCPESTGENRGKAPPRIGQTRTYKVQRVKKQKKNASGEMVDLGMSGPFVRLPLDSLGNADLSKILVSFENGRITVTPVDGPVVAVEELDQAA